MKTYLSVLALLLLGFNNLYAQVSDPNANEIIALAEKKWKWMADKNVDSLENLFHEQSVFVHMGGLGVKNKKSKSSRMEISGIKKQIFTALRSKL